MWAGMEAGASALGKRMRTATEFSRTECFGIKRKPRTRSTFRVDVGGEQSSLTHTQHTL